MFVTIMSDRVVALLRRSPIFSVAPETELAALAALAVEARFEVPTLLVARGDCPQQLWHVLQGAVEIGLFSAKGRPARLAPIQPGGWATWISCFSQTPLPHDLWTTAGARLLAFPSAAVRSLSDRHPQIYPQLIARIGERMRDLIGWSLAASLSDPERRLAYLLAVTARDHTGAGDGPMALSLTQDRIAAMGLGSRQRVARLLRSLAARGLIATAYGAVSVRSVRALEAFAAP